MDHGIPDGGGMQDGRRDTRGFVAGEFMIAVLILGVIFLMTLKGTAMIVSMQAIATRYQMLDFQNKIQEYLAQYHELPGDDPEAPQRWGRSRAVVIVDRAAVSFTGDDRIQGDLSDPLNPDGEQYMAWRDLRYAGFLEGDPSIAGESARPENYFGGVFGFAEKNLGLDQVLCATNVPGRAAQAIDQKLDDGNISTGRVRATSQWDPAHTKNTFDAPDAKPYDPKKTYIICIPIMP